MGYTGSRSTFYRFLSKLKAEKAHIKAVERFETLAGKQAQFVSSRAQGILFLGPPGVGKTHLSIALGLKACEKRKRVLFVCANELIDQLIVARVNGSMGKKLQMLSRLDLLIIDELGYLPINKEGANLFFQLISRRYEKGSVIISSNKPFDEWADIFCDDVIAAAILDRLLHHCHIIVINGPSYRTRDKMKAKSNDS